MALWYKLLETLLPFEWVNFSFMKNALLAVILVSAGLGLLSTMIISNKMAFFSDVIGHSALTGVAIGVLLGIANPLPIMLIFAVLLAAAINLFKRLTKSSSDTVIGVFFAVIVAFGIVILSRGGGFNKFTAYLIGDILSITHLEILFLLLMLIGIAVFWAMTKNSFLLIALSPSLARSRNIPVFFLQTLFSAFVAFVVTLSIRWVGILIINSLLVLPAAGSRLLARNSVQYAGYSILIALFAGITGLILSFYMGTSSGATIVLICAGAYVLLAILRFLRRR